ncbi:MAG: PaaX family transcriptional regulator C-terminal domain-containing protein [Patescibacteria group bacterium]
MAKKLRIRDKLLLGLALSADIILPATLRAMRGLPPQSLSLWGPPAYKKENFYSLASRLVKTNFIEKIIKDGQPYLRLSNQGRIRLNRDFPLLLMQQKGWDGQWRIVIFDISEASRYIRDVLREKLKSLGFGKLQQSVYISPYDFEQDLAEFLESHHLLGKAFVLTAKHRLMGDAQTLANYVWKLDKINGEYQEILDKLEKLKLPKAAEEKTALIQQLRIEYFDLLLKDPLLPKELLPDDWLGFSVRRVISNIST